MARADVDTRKQWEDVFDPASYEIARSVLAADEERAHGEIAAEGRRRARIVAAVAAIWVLCSVGLAFANSELMLVAEIGWIVIVAWAVFRLMPTFAGRANLGDLYGQYEAQLTKLEEAHIAIPAPSCMEELVAAIDLASSVE